MEPLNTYPILWELRRIGPCIYRKLSFKPTSAQASRGKGKLTLLLSKVATLESHSQLSLNPVTSLKMAGQQDSEHQPPLSPPAQTTLSDELCFLLVAWPLDSSLKTIVLSFSLHKLRPWCHSISTHFLAKTQSDWKAFTIQGDGVHRSLNSSLVKWNKVDHEHGRTLQPFQLHI